jgi:hypothetical protein
MTECVRCDDCERLYANKAACPHWLLDIKRKTRAQAEAKAKALAEGRSETRAV